MLLRSWGTLSATSWILAPGRQQTSCDSLPGQQMCVSVPFIRVAHCKHSMFVFMVTLPVDTQNLYSIIRGFWSECWSVEIELKHCFCGSWGLKECPAQWWWGGSIHCRWMALKPQICPFQPLSSAQPVNCLLLFSHLSQQAINLSTLRASIPIERCQGFSESSLYKWHD